MSTDEAIRGILRSELRQLEERLERKIGEGVFAGPDLLSVPKAAQAVGLHPSTVRAQYLGRLTKYGSGRKVRVSVAELRQLMRVEASGEEVDLDAKADALEKKGRRR